MLENNISDLDEETQQHLKKNPLAMMVYQVLGPPAPKPLFKTREEYEKYEREMREKLEPEWEKLRIANARSWASARYKLLD